VPDGIEIVYLPPYTPELQPAETLWVHVDEPIVNKHMQTIDELDQAIAQQCRILSHDKPRIKSQTYFSWWPQKQTAN
jgi:transposase